MPTWTAPCPSELGLRMTVLVLLSVQEPLLVKEPKSKPVSMVLTQVMAA